MQARRSGVRGSSAGSRQSLRACLVSACLLVAGCSSVVTEGTSAGAGIVSGSVAGSVGANAGVATGIGIGIQAAARAGVQYGQRRFHDETQTRIASIAGSLAPGQIRPWQTDGVLGLEPAEGGRVTVSRVIGPRLMACKEIVFSVDRAGDKNLPNSEFYVASICRSGDSWRWASAEPATARWGALQ